MVEWLDGIIDNVMILEKSKTFRNPEGFNDKIAQNQNAYPRIISAFTISNSELYHNVFEKTSNEYESERQELIVEILSNLGRKLSRKKKTKIMFSKIVKKYQPVICPTIKTPQSNKKHASPNPKYCLMYRDWETDRKSVV